MCACLGVYIAYICICTWMQGKLLRFVMAPGCVIVVICSATCNLRQTRFTSSVHTWKPANVSVSVRVSFLPTSLFFFLLLFTILWLLHCCWQSYLHTHTYTYAHKYSCCVWRYLYQNIISWVCYVWRVSIKKAGEWVKEREREQCITFFDGNKNKFYFLDICLNNCRCCCSCLSVIDNCRS